MKNPYFIGIGGAAMAWLADWCLANGIPVSGSDMAENKTVKRLIAAGATIHVGTDPSLIPADSTEGIISSAITPGSPSYPELEELKKRGIPVEKCSVYTGALTRKMKTIAVAGTHGKTTTTAMIGWILEKAGMDPTVFTGSTLKEWDNKTRIGRGEYLVLEADEFDRRFHAYSPDIAVIVNIDADHLDYYTGGLPEIEHSFRRFLRNLPLHTGLVVAYGRDARIRKASKGFKYAFRWYDEEHLWPGLHLQMRGTHMLLNATAAARVAHELGVPQKTILSALASFPGTARRFESLGAWGNRDVYDDYAHHPREIAATLGAARETAGEKALTVVFQPHQKARTKNLLAEFGRAFDATPPNRLILMPIFQVAGREEDLAVTSQDIADQIALKAPKGLAVLVAATVEEAERLVRQESATPGLLLSMGAGDIRSRMERWMMSESIS